MEPRFLVLVNDRGTNSHLLARIALNGHLICVISHGCPHGDALHKARVDIDHWVRRKQALERLRLRHEGWAGMNSSYRC